MEIGQKAAAVTQMRHGISSERVLEVEVVASDLTLYVILR